MYHRVQTLLLLHLTKFASILYDAGVSRGRWMIYPTSTIGMRSYVTVEGAEFLRCRRAICVGRSSFRSSVFHPCPSVNPSFISLRTQSCSAQIICPVAEVAMMSQKKREVGKEEE